MTQVEIRQQEATQLLRSLAPGSAQIILTDPPYGIAYHSGHYKDKNPHAPVARDWNFQIGSFLNVAAQPLKEGGVIYLFCRWDVYPLWVQQIPPPLKLKNAIIWVKDNWSAGDLTGNFGYQYEILMMLTKGRHTIRGHRYPNVWPFPRVPSKSLTHPTEKPVPVLQRAIIASSDEGDLIVDPFCGSGSTGTAAVSTNRNVLLGDIDPKMVRLTAERLDVPCPEMVDAEPESMPVDPCYNLEPPDPNLWGIHPEDLAEWIKRSTGPA